MLNKDYNKYKTCIDKINGDKRIKIKDIDNPDNKKLFLKT